MSKWDLSSHLVCRAKGRWRLRAVLRERSRSFSLLPGAASETDAGGSVVVEQLGVSDLAAHDTDRAWPVYFMMERSLLPRLGRGGGEPGAQKELAEAVGGAEQRALVDKRQIDPVAHGPHRARSGAAAVRDAHLAPEPLLVCLGAADGDVVPVVVEMEVLHVQGDELGAATAAGEAEAEQRPVPAVARILLPHRLDQGAHSVDQDGSSASARPRWPGGYPGAPR
jgi:hypothetical protein